MNKRNELYFGSDNTFTLAAELDPEDELLLEVACDCELDRYITLDEMRALRDHLDALLKEHEQNTL